MLVCAGPAGYANPPKRRMSEEIKHLPGGQRRPLQAAMAEIVDAYGEETQGGRAIRYQGQFIRVQKMQFGAQQPICIYREDWPKVERAAGMAPGVADRESSASFERDDGANRGGWRMCRVKGACSRTARHAAKCAE
jgi:hypothetical protein